MRNFYTVKDVAFMSGLTERTIRNYIQWGLLKGRKTEGTWRFAPEEVDAFFKHPSVLPSIQSKRNGVVLDFLANRCTTQNRICVILDLPKNDGRKAYEWFVRVCNSGSYESGLEFYYEDFEGYPRVILKGAAEDVLSIMRQYQAMDEFGGDRHEV